MTWSLGCEPPIDPPDESAYCPVCCACVDDAERETVGNWELVICPWCNAEVNVEQTLSARDVRQLAREDAADMERDERWFRGERTP